METLPVEIIEKIICSKNLSIRDVINFSLTNRYNNLLVTNISSSIWKKKCLQTCPKLAELFNNNFTNINWYAEVRYIYDLKRRTREILSSMSSRFFKSYVLSNSDFTEWFELCQEKPQTYHYLVKDLTKIVNTHVPIESIEVVPITTPGNKTLQHYAMTVLRYLRQLHLAKEWAAFIALPQKLQTLEKGITFIGEWFQPNSVSWRNIATELDKLTEEVRVNLKVTNPNHPLFVVPNEQLKIWRNENIECFNKYDFLHCAQIKCAMAAVLKYQFENSYTFNNIFLAVRLLDKIVGSAGGAISLIIYESVGRRLGVKHEPIVLSRGFNYLRSCSEVPYQYINFYDCYYGNGEPKPSATNFPVATTQKIIECIAKRVQIPFIPILPNIVTAEAVRRGLQFREPARSFDTTIKLKLTRFYMDYNMDSTSYTEVLMQQRNLEPVHVQRFINKLQPYEAYTKNPASPYRKVQSPMVRRPPHLKYAVGMVMQCRLMENTPLCVICDWDPACLYSNTEPCYNVLFKNGSYSDVKQDGLKLPCIRSSDFLAWCFKDIGWSFSHRCGAVFIPNAEKEREYPADTAVRNMYNEQLKPRD